MSVVDESEEGVKLITVEVNGETRIAAIDCTGDKVQCECGKTFRAFDKGGCTAHVRSNAHQKSMERRSKSSQKKAKQPKIRSIFDQMKARIAEPTEESEDESEDESGDQAVEDVLDEDLGEQAVEDVLDEDLGADSATDQLGVIDLTTASHEDFKKCEGVIPEALQTRGIRSFILKMEQ